MLNLINEIGVLGLPLIIIALTILFLTAWYGIKLWSRKAETAIDINSIIYLGIFGLSLGVFSHFLGLYEASKIVSQLRSEQIAAGYGQSLLALLYGFAIFFIASVSWFVLRLKVRRLQLMAD